MNYKKNMLLGLLVLLGGVFGIALGSDTASLKTEDDISSVSSESVDSIDASSDAESEGRVDLDDLKKVAEAGGFGYKTANLLMLKGVCRKFNAHQAKAGAKLAVPEFLGISSQKIQEKLLEEDFNLAERWKAVAESNGAAELDSIFKTKQFPSAFLAGRDALEGALNAAWMSIVLPEGSGLDDFFATKGLDALLAEVSARGNRLMVRSTGKEDTKEFANAGGNASVANVEPTAQAVLEAMGEVVASYFGKKSLSQRLGLGDRSIFDPTPFTPVLIQEMIGEKEGEAVPACGVMFTEEPEGGIAHKNILNKDGGVKTTGITLIQGAYGHNEGVVNSLIPVDTYYVVSLKIGTPIDIYPVIRPKTARMVPSNGAAAAVAQVPAVGGAGRKAVVPVATAAAKLKMIKNSEPLVTSQALSKEQLLALKGFAQDLEQFYGYPMDVEFVAKNDTIFIVQARPIVYKAGVEGPSYLEFNADFKGKKFNGSTIGAAGGSVRLIESADELIVAPTIGVALSIYLNPGFDKTKVKAILVGAMAPSTSHEATTFRNEGLPVMCLPDWDKVVAEIPSGGVLALSSQQNMGVVVASLSDFVIKLGWSSYPIPRALSVFANERERRSTYLTNTGKSRLLVELLAIMKTGDTKSVYSAVKEMWWRGDVLAKQYAIESSLGEDAKALSQKIFSLGARIYVRSRFSPDDDLYLLRLLPIRMLEALIYQQIPQDEVVNPISMATLGKVMREEAIISAEIDNTAIAGVPGAPPVAKAIPVVFASEKMRPYYTQLRKLDNNIFVDEVRADWDWLLAQAAASPVLLRDLVDLVKNLNDVSLLPTWLHSDFAASIRTLNKASATPADLNALMAGWKQKLTQDKDFLAALKEKLQDLKALNGGAFGVASSCKAAWQDLKVRFVDYFAEEAFTEAFKVAGPYARQAAVKIMHEMITAFDEAIKGVKGNPDLPNTEKLPLFQKMLQENFRMLKAWVALVPRAEEGIADPLEAWIYGKGVLSTRENYFEMMSNLVNKTAFTGVDLLPTEGVSTFIFAMGSGHAWYVDRLNLPQPKTGEDVFSIMHQSLLNCCVILAPKQDSLYPAILVDLEKIIKSTAGHSLGALTPNLLGINFSHNETIIHYNIPLNNHSCQIRLAYAHKNKQVSVSLDFCGGYATERYRWCNIAGLGLLAGMVGRGELLKTNINILSNHLLSMDIKLLQTNKEAMDLFALGLNDFVLLAFTQKPSYGRYRGCTAEGVTHAIKTLNAFNQKNIGLEASFLLIKNGISNKLLQDETIKLCAQAGIDSGHSSMIISALGLLSDFPELDKDLNGKMVLAALPIIKKQPDYLRDIFFKQIIKLLGGRDQATAYMDSILAFPEQYNAFMKASVRDLKQFIAYQRR